MRVLICGGRDFDDEHEFERVMGILRERIPDMEIISGGARGADSLASHYARTHGLPLHMFPADWDNVGHPEARIKVRPDGTKYDAGAGFRRNQRMLDEGQPFLVVAFSGGRGTADMLRRATKAGISTIQVAK